MNTALTSKPFHTGQTVRVRDLHEILETLDADGKLDGLPFMPEMTQFCGQSYQISCIPEKICIEGVGFRSPENIVFLDKLRCDGAAHDGCQRDCLLFWNEAWLSDRQEDISNPKTQDSPVPQTMNILKSTSGDHYFCQSTELASARSTFLPYSSSLPEGKLALLKIFIKDVLRGKMSVSSLMARIFNSLIVRLKPLLGIDPHGRIIGQRQKTDSLCLDLQPGEWVEVKSRKEIAQTLDSNGKNRGLLFDIPMAEYCGKKFQVESQLRNIILEETGQMVTLTNTVLLRNNVCTAWDCPRANRFFWREIWLKRIAAPGDT